MTTAADILARVPPRRKYATRSLAGELERSGDHLLLRSRKAYADPAGIDRGRMSVPCVISTQDEDRSRDVVVTAGIELAEHRANPVVLVEHGLEAGLTFPIGKAEDGQGRYTVEPGSGVLRAVTHFSQSSLVAAQIFQLVEEGIMRGMSIGFIPIDQEERRGGGMLVRRSSLFEYSHCTVPDNPYALADRIGGGRLAGQPIEEALHKRLKAHLPPLRKQARGGWDGGRRTAAQTAPTPSRPSDEYVAFSDADDGILPGVRVLHALHGDLAILATFLKESRRSQEVPRIAAFLDGVAEEVAGLVARVREVFCQHYPDEEPLRDGPPTFLGRAKALAPVPAAKALELSRWLEDLGEMKGRLSSGTRRWAAEHAKALRTIARDRSCWVDADQALPAPPGPEKLALLAQKADLEARIERADAQLAKVRKRHDALVEQVRRGQAWRN